MRQYWVAPIPPFHTADGAAYTGTAAIGDISPAPSIVIPANFLEAGSRLEFSAFGRFTSTGTPGTVIAGIYIGTGAISSGQALAATSALTVKTSQTATTWRVEGNASIRTVGASTAATAIGVIEVSNITTNGTDMGPAATPTALAFDSTIANKIMLGVTPSVTTGSWTCHYFGVRLVN